MKSKVEEQSERKAQFAIDRIRDILADDANYQSASLKLGGIWNWCDITAQYRRFNHTLGSAIEVNIKDHLWSNEDELLRLRTLVGQARGIFRAMEERRVADDFPGCIHAWEQLADAEPRT